MSAMFWVTFACGSMIQVYSADAKSMKRADIAASYKKAAEKAKKRIARHKGGVVPKIINVRCVG